jgi:hypothetical protein
MDWAVALNVASGISTFLGIAAFVAVLFFWSESNKKQRSLQEALVHAAFTAEETKIILEITPEADRYKTLKAILQSRGKDAERVLGLVRTDIDPLASQLVSSRERSRRFAVAAVVFLALAVLAYAAAGENRPRPPPEKAEVAITRIEDFTASVCVGDSRRDVLLRTDALRLTPAPTTYTALYKPQTGTAMFRRRDNGVWRPAEATEGGSKGQEEQRLTLPVRDGVAEYQLLLTGMHGDNVYGSGFVSGNYIITKISLTVALPPEAKDKFEQGKFDPAQPDGTCVWKELFVAECTGLSIQSRATFAIHFKINWPPC